MTAPSPLHAALPALESAAARRRNRLLAAFQHRRAGDLHLTARIASQRDRLAAVGWIGFDTPDGTAWLAPLLVAGDMARTGGSAPDAAALAAVLEPLEPLVAAVERVLGRELLPTRIDATVDQDEALLRIDAAPTGGAARHRILLALPGGALPLGPALSPAARVTFPRATTCVAVRLLGSPVAASRFATLAVGDLLLLGSAGLLVQTSFTGASTHVGALDLNRGSLSLQDMVHGDAGAPPTSEGELRVATTIEFDGIAITGDEAAALAPGSVLELPARGGTLQVRVSAGGTPIGDGELVALGQGFGVLLTRIALQPTPLPEMEAAPQPEPAEPA